MRVKVCGMTQLDQVRKLDELGVDFAGFIFYPKSPRYAARHINGQELRKAKLRIGKVGVFVNTPYEEMMRTVDEYGLDMVQLHGDETASFCNRISDRIKVIKAFRIKDFDTNIDWLVQEYDEVCDYYLFDKGSAGLYGGTGQKFNWNLLEKSNIGKPFFLSGGICREDVAALKNFNHPFFYGVDVNSRFETKPGIKDMALIKEFVNDLKQ